MTTALSLIVTNGDQVLCDHCYGEQLCEQDPATHFYDRISYGECSSCGMVVMLIDEEVPV
jgi:hypothetical protein